MLSSNILEDPGTVEIQGQMISTIILGKSQKTKTKTKGTKKNKLKSLFLGKQQLGLYIVEITVIKLFNSFSTSAFIND